MFKLKEIRINAKINQKETAKRLNVNRSSYAMWESGNEIIPIKRLLDFSNIFNVSIDFCLGLNTKNNQITNYNKEKSITRLKEFRKE